MEVEGVEETDDCWLKGQIMTPTQGSFLREVFGAQLGGRFKYRLIDENDDPCPYVLRTSFRTDGLQLHCLVINTKSQKMPSRPESNLTILEQAKQPRKRKKIESDEAPESWSSIQKIIGIDFGELNAVGAVCKNVNNYYIANHELHQKQKAPLTNLLIRTKALSEPSRKFRTWLNHQKSKVFAIH